MTAAKLKTPKIVLLSASAILLSLVVLVASNFYFLKMTNENLAIIENTYNRKLDILSRMMHIVRERSLVMLAMYVEDDEWAIDEQFMKFNALAMRFIRLRKQLSEVGLTPVEREELDKALAFIRTTEPLQDAIIEKIRSGGDAELRTDISRKDLPLEFKLLDVFNTLTNNVRENGVKARNEARQTYKRSQYVAALVSLLIVLSVMALMYRSLRKIRIIERSLIEESATLTWDATHDPLTNIHNRRWLEHQIEQLGKRETDKHAVNALIYLDLDNFKLINDRFGHAAGDRYLVGFCREVEHCIRQHDIFARIGGDEFVILLENCDLQNARDIATKILEKIQSFAIVFDGKRLAANCSIGLLQFTMRDVNHKDLLHEVDAYCYEAKRMGKNNIYSGAA
jgi:diguanylate cyclase (GGDEF)-like protein